MGGGSSSLLRFRDSFLHSFVGSLDHWLIYSFQGVGAGATGA